MEFQKLGISGLWKMLKSESHCEQSRSSRPPNPPIGGGPTLPKEAPNCLEGPEVASIQKQSFAWRIALNGIFCAQILYISVLKFFAIVYFQIAS